MILAACTGVSYPLPVSGKTCQRMRAVEENNVYVETSELKKLRRRLDETESDLGRPQLAPVIERWHSAAVELESILSLESKALENERKTLSGMTSRLNARVEDIATLTRLLRGQSETPKSEGEFDAQRKLEVSTRELATLSRLLRTAEDNARWLGDVHAALISCPPWWNVMPARWKQRKRAERLSRLGLFDTKAYLKRYPDIAKDGIEPLRHYIEHGLAEGRLR